MNQEELTKSVMMIYEKLTNTLVTMKVLQRFKSSSVNCVVQMTGQGVSRAMSSSLYAINRREITSQLYKGCSHIVPCHLMKDSNVIDKDGHTNCNPSLS